MRIAISFAVLCCLAGILVADPPVTPAPAAPPQVEKPTDLEEKPVSFWMEKKLEYSQALLRDLATGDFTSIAKSGRQLRTLSRVEGFVRSRNPDYKAHLNMFERVCDEIVRQAEKKNLEGATLAFNQMTVSCVSCHRSLRQD